MKKNLFKLNYLSLLFLTIFFQADKAFSQVAEWRLVFKNYVGDNPDGAGPAVGTAQFSLEMRAVSGTISAREISVGYSYQSTKAMVPTTSTCATTNATPSNITVSPEFVNAGYLTYNNVNQCNITATSTGGQLFDRTASGNLDQGAITLTTTWVTAFTVTLWALVPLDNQPIGGFAMLYSSSTGTPGPLSSYSMADASGNEVPVNSLTYSNPIKLPITLSGFNINCSDGGPKLNWQTMSEENNNYFEIERSDNGASGWTSIGKYEAAGNSNVRKNYEFVDLKGTSAFYRLKQVDKDGKFTYSSVQRSTCQPKQTNLFVYPVPARDMLNVVVGVDKNSKASILLVDLSGRTIRQLNTDLQKGTNNLRMNVAGLASGEYFLRVVGSEIVKTQKVTITK
ncbi:MAG: type sorting protein [Segetibacter sp.]|nr:type sorting protein [Segetibacter sp.]